MNEPTQPTQENYSDAYQRGYRDGSTSSELPARVARLAAVVALAVTVWWSSGELVEAVAELFE